MSFRVIPDGILWPDHDGAELTPTWSELIQRNLSTLKYHMRKMADADTEVERRHHEVEAQWRIRLHNKMVEENRRVLNAR